VTRYDGLHVKPTDKDKILLWWLNGGDGAYRVFYGDLSTKILSKAEAASAIAPRPKIFAAPQADDQQPAKQH
jgi:hypothetical protein